MGLIVFWFVFVVDVIFFFVIGYVIVFFIRRFNKYGDFQLNVFIKWLLVFFVIGEIGRIIDLIDDFCCVSLFDIFQYVMYFIFIVGIIYFVIYYIKFVEMKYLFVVKKVLKLKSLFKVYIVFFKNRLFDVIDVFKEGDFFVFVIMRFFDFYLGFNRENVFVIWVMQSGKGVVLIVFYVFQGIIFDFVQENLGLVVIIDCFEYLMFYNDFKLVFKFLFVFKDYVVIQYGLGLIVFVDEEVLSNQERVFFLKEFELF